MSAADRPARFPVLLDVSGRLVVIVGASRASERMAASLAAHGADVVIIAPTASADALAMQADGVLTIEPRGYVRGDLKGAFIVVSASGSAEVDAAVAEEASQAGALTIVPADAGASDLTVPSVVRRGAMQIAVSTDGIAPAVAQRVRRELAAKYGPEWGVYVALMGAVRTRAIETLGLTDRDLAPLYDAVAASDVIGRIRSGEDPDAEGILKEFAATLPGAADVTEED
jgi:precorrin-2 dehydrogenase/sirohydrochlorin ferrochelatase